MSEENNILFQNFLSNDLSENDRNAFNNRLNTDSEFKSEFELFKMLEAHIEEKVKYGEGLETISNVSAKRKHIKPRYRFKIKYIVLAAVLLLLSFVIYKLNKKTTIPPSFAEVYVEPDWQITKGDNNRLSKIISLGLSDQYQSALDSLRVLGLTKKDLNYWSAEITVYHQDFQQAKLFVDKLEYANNLERDRNNYLKIVTSYFLGKYEETNILIDSLPMETASFYKSFYAKLID